MFRRAFRVVPTALLSFCLVGPAMFSARADDRTAELRQQIEALQRQVEQIENQPSPKKNVTQIGASRLKKATTGLVVRVYELNDLFAVAPPYAASVASDLGDGDRPIFGRPEGFGGSGGTGGGGFGGGGFFSLGMGGASPHAALAVAAAGQAGNKSAVKSSQDELMTVIRETISPDLWQGEGKISRLGNAFVISADEDTHSQIESLLNLFRERWGTLRTISVRAWWVPLSPAEARLMLDAPTEKVTDDGAPVFGVVGDEGWRKILQTWEKPAGEAARRHAYQATLTAYNGQTVSTLSGVQSLGVTRVETVASTSDDGGKVCEAGYAPTVSVVQEGLAFQMTPISNVSGRTVLLDVHSRLVVPSGETKPGADDRAVARIMPRDVAAPIDRRKLLVHRLSTTARVPADRPYLVGGMSIAGPDVDGQTLYLFVKVSVQELRNDRDGGEKRAEEAAKPAEKEDREKAEPKEPKQEEKRNES